MTDNRKTLHIYFDEKESKQFDQFINSMRTIGKVKVRQGDVVTAILKVAMNDDETVSKVKQYMTQG